MQVGRPPTLVHRQHHPNVDWRILDMFVKPALSYCGMILEFRRTEQVS